MDERDIDLKLGEVFKRSAPSFAPGELEPIIPLSPLERRPRKRRHPVVRPLAIGVAILVVLAAGVAAWQALSHAGGGDRVVVITDDTGTTTTVLGSSGRLSDGDWELWVDRVASLDNVRLPSDELSEDDYHTLAKTAGRPIFTITVSQNGERVSIKGQGTASEFRAEGTRTSVDTARITYDLDTAPGGRLVVWFTYKPDIQAELTQYGSGRPMIFSDRGQLVPVRPVDSTDTTDTMVPAQTEQLYPVQVEGKWGFIDKTGAIKIEPQFAGLRRLDGAGDILGFSEGLAPVQLAENGPWGYADTSGQVVIEPRFSLAQPFSEGLAVVRTADGWSFVDKTGAILFGPFDGAQSFSGGLAFVDDKGQAGFIDKDGAWMPDVQAPDGQRLRIYSGFSEGLAVVRTLAAPEGQPTAHFGYINESGAVVIDARFNIAFDFSEGLAAVGIGETEDAMKWGYIDSTGAWIVEPRFEEAGNFSEGLAPVRVNGKWGYIDTSGKVIIQPEFDTAQTFSDGLALVWWPRSCGYIDKTGKLVIPREYGTDGWDFSGGVARVGGGSPSYIDTTGKMIWQGK